VVKYLEFSRYMIRVRSPWYRRKSRTKVGLT